jgi:AmmeMemoRadiSam system protein B
MTEINSVRPSPIAGTWYSANPAQLRGTIERYMENASNPDLPGEVVGLVAPHAGYRYSGPVAAHAFRTVAGRVFKTVLVISPMHQYHPRPILTSAHRAYRTPLGDIPLAEQELQRISAKLEERTGLALTPVANDQEHSLEIELPFLQVALKHGFNLIPIMLRDQTSQIAMVLGEILGEQLKEKNCLMVASSDLSHFYTENQAHQLDEQVLDALTHFSPDELFDLKRRGEGQACGLSPMAAVLWAAQKLGADRVTLLHYDTSASSTGDRSSVVGYGAAAITRSS